MIATPPSIQSQLGEAISLIADSDFWERWDTLFDDLVSRLSIEDPVTTEGVLQVAHSILKRWRPLFRSDALYTEINHVASKFGVPFLSLMSSTDNAIDQNASNKDLLTKHLTVMNTSIKLLGDLSCQDLIEVLVENLDALVGLLDKYLTYDNPLVRTDDDAEAGPIEYIRAAVFSLLDMWTRKYEEDISSRIAGLSSTSWNLLTSLGPETKYDLVASRALNFLTSVCNHNKHAQNFNNQDTLTQVIERAVLPNIALREADVELFEDEPIEYIRRDLEGADSETRRRAATDFLRKLMEQFQELVTRHTMVYIQHFLQDYASNPAEKWQSKDTAIYLFCSIAAGGSVTGAAGVTSANPHVNLIEFFSQNIAQDLVSDKPSHIILQVDGVKFLYIFRSLLNSENWSQAFPMLVKHLASPNYVVHTYCAIAIERILAFSGQGEKPVITREQVQQHAESTLRLLFKLITRDTAPEKIQENEFLMRCVMRVLIVIREGSLQSLDFLLTSFSAITKLTRHNPSNPRFYYYMFESIGALIRFCAPKEPVKMEQALYEPFSGVLMEGVQEFTPYVFQLFAALLESNPAEGLSDYYQSLIGPVLSGSAWETRGNATALTRLLCVLLRRGSSVIVQNNQLEPVLGIFQNLLASKSTETSAFDLLETIIDSVPNDVLSKYYPQIFQLILTRLSASKTDQLTLRFVRLYHFMALRDASTGLGVDATVALLEGVQTGIFAQLFTSIILPDTQRLSRPLDRKMAVVSFTRALADSNAFAETYKRGWAHTATALLRLLINPPKVTPAAAEEHIAENDVDDMAFGVGFTQLATCRRPERDPMPQIGDVSSWAGQYLAQAAQKKPAIQQYVQERLDEETKTTLVKYMQGA